MVIEDVDQGIPQIPFDLFVKKKCKGLLNITNPFKSPVYLVQAAACSDHRRRRRVLIDTSGVTLISIHRNEDGSWRGFKGDEVVNENLVFRVERTLNTFDRVEMDAFIVRQNGEDSVFKLRGSVFWRSCTIYHENSLVAQVESLSSEKAMLLFRIEAVSKLIEENKSLMDIVDSSGTSHTDLESGSWEHSKSKLPPMFKDKIQFGKQHLWSFLRQL